MIEGTSGSVDVVSMVVGVDDVTHAVEAVSIDVGTGIGGFVGAVTGGVVDEVAADGGIEDVTALPVEVAEVPSLVDTVSPHVGSGEIPSSAAPSVRPPHATTVVLSANITARLTWRCIPERRDAYWSLNTATSRAPPQNGQPASERRTCRAQPGQGTS